MTQDDPQLQVRAILAQTISTLRGVGMVDDRSAWTLLLVQAANELLDPVVVQSALASMIDPIGYYSAHEDGGNDVPHSLQPGGI